MLLHLVDNAYVTDILPWKRETSENSTNMASMKEKAVCFHETKSSVTLKRRFGNREEIRWMF